ncbi:hypothetical protein DPMN_148766 [Dreissena polymorpha]|uniref:Protein quiver n=1 Tax=Dreissena polymorpha TaxID=45954 RepID=A0A9D4FAK4_DREPO|nr:hypothetical protein DPMN_148760 [Dreissena polymorpha]KAH3795218.1 hypothetical protein DPMN_148766 [Dreissena polymorpha]
MQAGLKDYICTNKETIGLKGEICWCNKNLCNGSETSAASGPAVALPLLLFAGILAVKNILTY